MQHILHYSSFIIVCYFILILILIVMIRYEEAVAVLEEALLRNPSESQLRNIHALLQDFRPCLNFAEKLSQRWEEARQQPLGLKWYTDTIIARTQITKQRCDVSAYRAAQDGVAYVMRQTNGEWDYGWVAL